MSKEKGTIFIKSDCEIRLEDEPVHSSPSKDSQTFCYDYNENQGTLTYRRENASYDFSRMIAYTNSGGISGRALVVILHWPAKRFGNRDGGASLSLPTRLRYRDPSATHTSTSQLRKCFPFNYELYRSTPWNVVSSTFILVTLGITYGVKVHTSFSVTSPSDEFHYPYDSKETIEPQHPKESFTTRPNTWNLHISGRDSDMHIQPALLLNMSASSSTRVVALPLCTSLAPISNIILHTAHHSEISFARSNSAVRLKQGRHRIGT